MTIAAQSSKKEDDRACVLEGRPTGSWVRDICKTSNRATLSANELISLGAMITYIAHNSCENEFRIERRVADHFGVANIKCLPAMQYDDAICFLVESLPKAA